MPYHQASRAAQSFFGSARLMIAYQKATNVAPLRGDLNLLIQDWVDKSVINNNH